MSPPLRAQARPQERLRPEPEEGGRGPAPTSVLFRQRLKYEIAEVMTEIDSLTSAEER